VSQEPETSGRIFCGITVGRLRELAPGMTDESAEAWLSRNERWLNQCLDEAVRLYLSEDGVSVSG